MTVEEAAKAGRAKDGTHGVVFVKATLSTELRKEVYRREKTRPSLDEGRQEARGKSELAEKKNEREKEKRGFSSSLKKMLPGTASF